MIKFKEEIVNEIKSLAITENFSDREAFFQIYLDKLEEAEIIEDSHYLHFVGKGYRNRNVQIDGYSYNGLDKKLTLFIIPTLTYYEEKILTVSEAKTIFNKALYYLKDSKKIISEAEESSEGYGLAYDIYEEKMDINILELFILTDMKKSEKMDIIESIYDSNMRIDFMVYDISRMKIMEESKSGKEPLYIDLLDFDSKGILALPSSKTNEYEAYLCNIPGTVLAKLYNKYQSRLLEGNVRSFLQTRGKVNKGIRNTILNNPEMFFAYNNGIAATAESIDFIETKEGLVIKGFKDLQIVNGGQTTASLANAWINDTRLNSREQINKIFVPMKLSVVSYENMQELIPNISKFANSQNKVSDADLASNHPFHIKIESLSRKITAPPVKGAQFGTFWYYERANGQYKQETYKSSKSVKKQFELTHPKNQMFKKVDLAKYYNIYLQKPHIASAGAQKSFNIFSKWMIEKWNKNQNFVNDEFFKKIIALTILFKRSDYIVRNQSWYDSYKANIVAYTLSSIFHKIEKYYPEYELDFNQIWKKQGLSDSWIKQIQMVSKLMYEHLTDENRTVENVTEWAKRQYSWDIAKNIDFDLNEEFFKNFIDKELSINKDKEAKKNEKLNSEMNALVEVFEYGSEFWKEVYKWGELENIWNIQDKDFLNLAVNIDKKVPSDRQAIKILQVLEKARVESFPK
ncbi:AIPR family protein [Staphylococcus lentus]|uniref:AIPR family protein n=1 Tax=Mammaliicoccus lentus TaxID=42858 RepID=UPI001883ED29|nr:AIPR family protein [Mammaliicoccus lentus]MBF0841007.1 AIPR family protein [Mammaliicoccus lentus]